MVRSKGEINTLDFESLEKAFIENNCLQKFYDKLQPDNRFTMSVLDKAKMAFGEKICEDVAIRLYNNALGLYRENKPFHSLLLWYIASAFFAQHHNVELEIKAKVNIGAAFLSLGRYQLAEIWSNSALLLARKHHEAELEYQCYINLGVASYHLGRLSAAEIHYNQALELISKSSGDIQQEMLIYGNLGNIARDRCLYNQATQYYEMASRMAIKLKDGQQQSNWELNLAAIKMDCGDWDSAVVQTRRVLTKADESQNQSCAGRAHLQLAYLLSVKGHFLQAQEQVCLSQKIARDINDLQLSYNASLTLGNLFFLFGENLKARDCFIRAKRAAELSGDLAGKGLCLMMLGNVINSETNFQQASTLLHGAVEIFSRIPDNKLLARSHCNLGILLMGHKDYEQTRYHFKKAFDLSKLVSDIHQQAFCLLGLGASCSDEKKSRMYYKRAYKLAEQVGNPHLKANILCSMISDLPQDQLDLVLAYSREMLESLEYMIEEVPNESPSVHFYRSHYYHYKVAVCQFFNAGLYNDMYTTVQRCRSRAFLKILRITEVVQNDPVIKSLTPEEQKLFAEEHRLRCQLVGMGPKLNQAVINVFKFNSEISQSWRRTVEKIRQHIPEYADFILGKPATLKTIRQWLCRRV